MSDIPETSCTFCEIVAGVLPASKVHEDELVLAILDIRPVNPGHMLVLPKQHYPSLADLPEAVGAPLFTVAQRTAAAIRRSGVRCEGIRLTLADGAAAGQDVFHLHLHVIPRFAGDSYRVIVDWSPGPPREELDAVGQRIRAALSGDSDIVPQCRGAR
jgi:histidine triad (HIT) family protein